MGHHEFIGRPIKVAGQGLELSGRFVRGVGDHFMKRAAEQEGIVAQQSLEPFKGHLGVVSAFEKDKTAQKLAWSALSDSVVRPGGIAEIRPAVTAESFEDKSRVDPLNQAAQALCEALQGSQVDAIPYLSPHILDSAAAGDPHYEHWKVFARDLDALRIQHTGQADVATIMMALPEEADTIFGSQVVDNVLESAGHMAVLRHVGELPQDNLLLPTGWRLHEGMPNPVVEKPYLETQ